MQHSAVILQCSVCGDKCDGYHYGALCCAGCKAFFRRTIRSDLHYVCDSNGTCEIFAKYRNSCRSCRMQRCIQAGMDERALQSDRGRINRNRADKRPKLKLQSPRPDLPPPPLGPMIPPSPAEFYCKQEPISPASDYSEAYATITTPPARSVPEADLSKLNILIDQQEIANVIMPLAIIPLRELLQAVRKNYRSILKYFMQRHQYLKRSSIRKMCDSPMDSMFQRQNLFEPADLTMFTRQIRAHLTATADVLTCCPCFSSLLHHNRVIEMTLLRAYAPQGILLSNIMSTVPVVGDDFVVLLDGLHVLHRNSTNYAIINNIINEVLDDLIPRSRMLDPDAQEFSCLRALALWNPDLVDRHGKDKVYRIQQTVLIVLEKHIQDREDLGESDTAASRYGNLLMLLKSIQATGERMRQCVQLARYLNLLDLDEFVQNMFRDPKPISHENQEDAAVQNAQYYMAATNNNHSSAPTPAYTAEYGQPIYANCCAMQSMACGHCYAEPRS